jgi:phosphoglycerate dehydrogenase-like enzyme
MVGVMPAHVQDLERKVPEVQIVAVRQEALPDAIASADALVGYCPGELARKSSRLRWIQAIGAGVEEYSFEDLMAAGITLTNGKILQGPEIGDHAMALLLALTRSLHLMLRSPATREWIAPCARPIELRGKTAVVLGFGGIGVQIVERAVGFGMRILTVTPEDVPHMNAIQHSYKPDQLAEVLPLADVLFLAAALTRETTGIIGRRELALMKRSAYLINVTRGRMIRTDALVEALREGRLAGVGLDVTDPEPLPPDHPLWTFENVVITPHLAGVSDGHHERRLELFRDNLRRFARGLPLRNVVDMARGY